MEISALVALLTPCLPTLVKLGGKAGDGAVQKLGEQALESTQALAKKVWGVLGPKVEANQDVKAAAEQAAAKPESKARMAVFEEELIALLKQDLALMDQITGLLQEHEGQGGQTRQTIQVNKGVILESAENSKVIGSIMIEQGNVHL